MRQILLFAALAAVLALLLVSCGGTKDNPVPTEEDAPGKAAYHKISAEEAYEMMISQEIVVVDVRTREEYDGGHIENAVLVPNESIGSEMPETLPDSYRLVRNRLCKQSRVPKGAALACRLGQALQNATHFEVATGDPRPFGFSVHIVLRTM